MSCPLGLGRAAGGVCEALGGVLGVAVSFHFRPLPRARRCNAGFTETGHWYCLRVRPQKGHLIAAVYFLTAQLGRP